MSRIPSHRPERLAALIRQTLAETLAVRVKDPRVGCVTVTGVSVSPDATHARVRVSVLGEEADKARALQGLESARGFMRTRLARVLNLRSTPELQFELDRGLEHAQHIERLLADLKRDEPPS